jgi:hypothetical protein
LIIHPNGDCITYFGKDGRKYRQVVKFAVNSLELQKSSFTGFGLIDKLLQALRFHNRYYDEPIFTR